MVAEGFCLDIEIYDGIRRQDEHYNNISRHPAQSEKPDWPRREVADCALSCVSTVFVCKSDTGEDNWNNDDHGISVFSVWV